MKQFNNLSVSFWSGLLAALFILSLHQAQLMGDGREYLLYANSISAHLSPDIRPQDIQYVGSILRASEQDFNNHAKLMGTGTPFGNGAQFDGKGYIRTSKGSIYSWHFWMYPAFVAPFLQITYWMGKSPAIAFVLCNWAFVFIAFIYLVWGWGGTPAQKQLLAGLFLLSGTTYYVWWTHPEVFTASLLLLALMTASDRRYLWSMFLVAIAATQNPPLLLLTAALAVMFAYDKHLIHLTCWRVSIRLKGNYQTILLSILALAIALAPVIFFYKVLGVSNPIVAAGAANMSLISLSRLNSLFFDLNQGMVVAIPGVFLGILILSFLGILMAWRRKKPAGVLVPFLPLLLGVLISIVMAVPALATTNWNHGQTVFSRYAYWLSIPIIFGFVASLKALPRRWETGLGATVIIIQLMTLAYYGIWGKNARSDYLDFKPIARYVFLHYPELYNPVPEIFIERLRHQEGMPNAYDKNVSEFSYPDEKNPTKILVPKSQVKDESIKLQHTCKSIVAKPVENNWVYLNIGHAGCAE